MAARLWATLSLNVFTDSKVLVCVCSHEFRCHFVAQSLITVRSKVFRAQKAG